MAFRWPTTWPSDGLQHGLSLGCLGHSVSGLHRMISGSFLNYWAKHHLQRRIPQRMISGIALFFYWALEPGCGILVLVWASGPFDT